MTELLYPRAARAAERQAIAAEYVTNFIPRHADGVWLLLEQAADPAGLTALGDLIALSHDPLRCPAAVQSAVAAIVAALSEMSQSAIERVEHAARATDLFAAHRWNLARVEELGRSFNGH